MTAVTAHAFQATSFTGTVLGTGKEPVQGATVVLTETATAQKRTTVTDKDGVFSFTGLTAGKKYQISCTAIGYAAYQQKDFIMRAGIGNSLLINLKTADKLLDEVVVTGYGTQKRAMVTGAVSQVTSEVLEDRPAPGLTRLLQGTLPNLNLKMVDGSPTRGAVYNIRGTTSIGAGGSALVLIDGVEGNPEFINPNDVESVTVLKDASSAAIYGSRAAFGVVLITTKSPKKGTVKVNVNSSYSMNQRTVTPDLITNGYTWAKNFDESFNAWYDYNSHPTVVNNIFPFSLEYLDRLREHDENPALSKVEYNASLGRYEYFGNTNWYKELYNDNIPSTEQAINVAGGSEKANYFLSGRYYFQDGIFKPNPDKFNKYNLRAKGEIAISPWLTAQNNFELSNYTYTYPMLADRDNQTIWRMMDLLSFPMATIYNPDGTLSHTGVYSGIGAFIDGNNKSKTKNVYFRNTIGLVARPWKNYLTVKGDFTYSRETNEETRVNNFVNYSTAPGQVSRLGRSLLQQLTNNRNYIASNFTAEYHNNFGNQHDLKALIGSNIETSTTRIFNASRDGLLVPNRPDFNLMDGLNYTITGGGNEWAYLGLFYRFNYAFRERYLLEVNGRYDGSSKFPAKQRYGFFPSVSAGWRITKEAFMSSTRSWLNDWKIRGSYGSLGNGNVQPYRYLEQMNVSKMSVILNGIQDNYTQLPGVIPAGLTWERSSTFDLGMDVSALSNRLTASFDWYNRNTKDMFTAGQPLPNTFGATVPYGNYADMSTKGWEFSLSWRDKGRLMGKPFEYGITGSLWDSRSKITRFNNPTGTLASTYYVGHTIGEIWGYTTAGLFTSADEIAHHANQDFLQNSNNRKLLPGDIKFVDVNNDGFINQGDNTIYKPGDRSIIGNNAPRYQFGFTLSAKWRGFGISAFFQGIGKRDWYFAPEAGLFWGLYNRPYGYQSEKMMNNRWTEENPNGYFPRLRGYAANAANRSLGAPQTRYLQNASYLRLKTLTIDYTLPQAWLQRLHLAGASVFFSTQNLFTLSGMYKYTRNIDVEVIEDPVGDLLNNSGQGYAYPMLKTTTLGLNLNF
ncbi:SusC/RagA family TonB-linked outer membrane protein [Filimonas effusa]|uniref:TonB-dependent receptor n=1 Tax=Filimonas effusa TaxID=2508721 RepID=A0A4Q1D2K8_9BACT|nr:TonB-dependent receptor [Filimonas effusa]RXK81457.1 TonB-dependent receptor [Filimonas effusa]